MSANDIRVVWLPLGLMPVTAYDGPAFPPKSYRTLHEAISETLHIYPKEYKRGFQPWLRAGAGDGAQLLNISGIKLLNEAYEEGQKASQS